MADDRNDPERPSDGEPETEPRHDESAESLENRRSAGGQREPFDEGTSMPNASIDSTFGTPRWGPYKILELIGEGGMGTVFRGLQTNPVRRDVAIKIIRFGMNTKEIVARFESERQALALMDHPNIAKILGAGTTEEGRPYFAMEYVRGIPLTDYCDKQKLGIRKRLDLFKQICVAVQHAHQKAIIHRDLKPSNILVTDHQGEPVSKIIDFGLAKAIGGQRLTEKTFFTAHGVMMGTPEYMSPEQADLSALDVDTRTDVYSLGAILYRLLTGCLPFDMSRFCHAERADSHDAIRRRICDHDPPKPSTRVSDKTIDLTPMPAEKNLSLTRNSLAKLLRDDLDWIVMKALEKDRTRRYSTAAELAADIERHLNHEPVQAGPPSTTYKLKKFVRKHAGSVASALSLVVLLLAGVITSTFFYLRSEERRAEAEEATRIANDARNLALTKEREAVNAKERETKQRKEAEHQRNELLQLSDVVRLQQLVSEANDLWSTHANQVDAMEDWRQRADKLVGNLDAHKTSLSLLRQQAVEVFDKTNGGSSQSASTKNEEGYKGNDVDDSDEIGRWTFADVEVQWQHDLLAALVAELQKFSDPDPRVGTIVNVDERLARAGVMSGEVMETYDVAWEEAVASIANEKECPAYKGLRIKPQIGLVPIGRDRESGLWEFGHPRTGEVPMQKADGELCLYDEAGLIFVLVPGGKLSRGARKNGLNIPSHGPRLGWAEVTLAPFFLSKYEMTQEQWKCLTNENPSQYQSGGFIVAPKYHPVESVSAEDCDLVLKRIGLLLPTEAQWEYAARAGTMTTWWTGNDLESLIGAENLADKAAKRARLLETHPRLLERAYESWLESDDGFVFHAPIGSGRANRFGLHEIHGNVREWCRTATSSFVSQRPVRGGSFQTTPFLATSTSSYPESPSSRAGDLGLRPMRIVDR